LSAKDRDSNTLQNLELEKKPSQLKIKTQQNSITTPHFGNLKELDRVSDLKVKNSSGLMNKNYSF
jgi:hypothetical protein